MKAPTFFGRCSLLGMVLLAQTAAADAGKAGGGTNERGRQLGLGSRAVAGKLLAAQVTPAWMHAAGGEAPLPGTLRWPVPRGWLSRGFGSGPGGYHLALDIMGKPGWPVHAAAAGIVGYAGSELRGFGNVILLIHPGGWVTLYAHNSKLLVRAGARVAAGTPIAKVGSTGTSRGPHLHFELIFRGTNCDPAPLLRPGIRHRSGKLTGPKRRVWRDPKTMPDGIACHRRRHKPKDAPEAPDAPDLPEEPAEAVVDEEEAASPGDV